MYLLSVLGILVCFLLVSFTQPGLRLYEFVDGMSFMVMVVLVIPIMLSTGFLKDLNNAFRLVWGKKKKDATLLELKRAKLAVEMVCRVLICSSVFVAIVQTIVLLHNMSDPAYLGPVISMILLAVLYAVVISLLMIPIRAKLEQRILEYIPSCSEKSEEAGVSSGRQESEEESCCKKMRCCCLLSFSDVVLF